MKVTCSRIVRFDAGHRLYQHEGKCQNIHGGSATLVEIKDNKVYLKLEGGCRGCAMARMTLKQGIERVIKEHVPEIEEVIDVTDHAGGTNPYQKED